MPCAPGDDECIPTINYDRAWAAALTLILIVMLLNLIGRAASPASSRPRTGRLDKDTDPWHSASTSRT